MLSEATASYDSKPPRTRPCSLGDYVRSASCRKVDFDGMSAFSGLRWTLRLARWGDKWVGFHCTAVFRKTVIQSVERRATLIQRNSDR